MPDRKTFLFFNCLLDGMHTRMKGCGDSSSFGSYRTKCVDRNPLNPFIYKGLRGFNLFLGNFEGGQNRVTGQMG